MSSEEYPRTREVYYVDVQREKLMSREVVLPITVLPICKCGSNVGQTNMVASMDPSKKINTPPDIRAVVCPECGRSTKTVNLFVVRPVRTDHRHPIMIWRWVYHSLRFEIVRQYVRAGADVDGVIDVYDYGDDDS